MISMDDTRKTEDGQDPATPGKDPNPLPDITKDRECVVAIGSVHHSARPGPGRIRFRPWDM